MSSLSGETHGSVPLDEMAPSSVVTLPRVELKNKSHNEFLVNSLYKMMCDNAMTDITLIAGDGHTIPVHKLVLVTSSPYFQYLHTQGSLDKRLLQFQGVDGAVLKELVRFMYTGSVQVTLETAAQIESAASQLGMKTLASTCRILLNQIQTTSSVSAGLTQPPSAQSGSVPLDTSSAVSSVARYTNSGSGLPQTLDPPAPPVTTLTLPVLPPAVQACGSGQAAVPASPVQQVPMVQGNNYSAILPQGSMQLSGASASLQRSVPSSRHGKAKIQPAIGQRTVAPSRVSQQVAGSVLSQSSLTELSSGSGVLPHLPQQGSIYQAPSAVQQGSIQPAPVRQGSLSLSRDEHAQLVAALRVSQGQSQQPIMTSDMKFVPVVSNHSMDSQPQSVVPSVTQASLKSEFVLPPPEASHDHVIEQTTEATDSNVESTEPRSTAIIKSLLGHEDTANPTGAQPSVTKKKPRSVTVLRASSSVNSDSGVQALDASVPSAIVTPSASTPANPNPYLCSSCGESFKKEKALRKHKIIHHYRTINQLHGLKLLKRHRRTKAVNNHCKKSELGYRCGYNGCEKLMFLKTACRAHILRAHRRRKLPSPSKRKWYECQYCHRGFKYLSNYRRHSAQCCTTKGGPSEVSKKKGPKQPSPIKRNPRLSRWQKAVIETELVCPVCRIIAPNVDVLTQHLYKDHRVFTFSLNDETKQKFQFACYLCDDSSLSPAFNSYNTIKNHLKKKHSYDLTKQCFVCATQIKNRSVLAHHLQSTHQIRSRVLKLEPLCNLFISGDVMNLEPDSASSVRCHYCRELFTDDKLLFEHLSSVHYQFADCEKVKSKRPIQDHYLCSECHHVSNTVHSMQSHLVSVHGVRKPVETSDGDWELRGVYRCQEEKCFYEGAQEWELAEHVDSTHPDVIYKCAECTFSTQLRYQFNVHKMKHERGAVCSVCGLLCKKVSALRYHKYKAHGIDDHTITIYRCSQDGCFFSTNQKSALANHQNRHDPKKPFLCPQCGRCLKTASSLETHISRVHVGFRPYQCDKCGKSFTKPGEMRAHLNKHTRDAMTCEHCKFTTVNKYSLISHMLSKHGIQVRENEKLHHCTLCPYKTMRAKHLQNHMNCHLNVRDFVCHLCGKTFTSSSSLKGHHNWVHAEKAYKCEFCNYKGGSLSNLKQHTRIMHTQRGLKPYKCFYCDFRCELSGNCRVHCRSAHKGMDIKWVKVVDFTQELPDTAAAEEIRTKEAEQRRKQLSVKEAVPRNVKLEPASASVVDQGQQLRSLLTTVSSELATLQRKPMEADEALRGSNIMTDQSMATYDPYALMNVDQVPNRDNVLHLIVPADGQTIGADLMDRGVRDGGHVMTEGQVMTEGGQGLGAATLQQLYQQYDQTGASLFAGSELST